jgi:hypothetical protein
MHHKFTAQLALAPPKITAGGLPDGHLEVINRLQRQVGKPELTGEQVIARPVRLTGNQLTDHYTKFPDGELEAMAAQINAGGAPMLSAHMTDETPMGRFYAASISAMPDGTRWLDTWAYWLPTADGLELAQQIDGGVINEASIGISAERALCSITGGDYWSSPYSRGQEYEILDPQTGQTTRKLCFVWMIGCTVNEGSLCYRGAHPGTQVGGQFALSLSAGAENSTLLQKRPQQQANPPALTLGKKGDGMDARILKALGLAASASETEALAALEARMTDVATLQKLTGANSSGEALAVVQAWQASHTALPEVTAQRNELQAAVTMSELEGLIAQGRKDLKLTTPEQLELARSMTPANLKAMLAVMLPNPVLAAKSPSEPNTAADGAAVNTALSSLTDDERMIVLQTGITEQAFLASKQKQAQSRAEA